MQRCGVAGFLHFPRANPFQQSEFSPDSLNYIFTWSCRDDVVIWSAVCIFYAPAKFAAKPTAISDVVARVKTAYLANCIFPLTNGATRLTSIGRKILEFIATKYTMAQFRIIPAKRCSYSSPHFRIVPPRSIIEVDPLKSRGSFFGRVAFISETWYGTTPFGDGDLPLKPK